MMRPRYEKRCTHAKSSDLRHTGLRAEPRRLQPLFAGQVALPREGSGSAPAQLMEAVLLDPVVMGDLMDDRHEDLLAQMVAVLREGVEGAPEAPDGVRRDDANGASTPPCDGDVVVDAQRRR